MFSLNKNHQTFLFINTLIFYKYEDPYNMDKAKKIDQNENFTQQNAWQGLQKGDINAIGELYDLFVDQLFNVGMGIVKDR